jgi:heme-degrading monooxygenase HmoA
MTQIVRIARARVKPGFEAEFERILESTTVPARSGIPGMLRLSRLRPIARADVIEYVILTRWRSRAELERYKAASGPVTAPELAHTLIGGSIEEYELLGEDEYEI